MKPVDTDCLDALQVVQLYVNCGSLKTWTILERLNCRPQTALFYYTYITICNDCVITFLGKIH